MANNYNDILCTNFILLDWELALFDEELIKFN